MDWAAAERSGWALATLAFLLGVALGYAVAWRIWKRRFDEQFEGMRETMLKFANENELLKAHMDRKEIAEALRHVDVG